jgi:hypothetical protein
VVAEALVEDFDSIGRGGGGPFLRLKDGRHFGLPMMHLREVQRLNLVLAEMKSVEQRNAQGGTSP